MSLESDIDVARYSEDDTGGNTVELEEESPHGENGRLRRRLNDETGSNSQNGFGRIGSEGARGRSSKSRMDAEFEHDTAKTGNYEDDSSSGKEDKFTLLKLLIWIYHVLLAVWSAAFHLELPDPLRCVLLGSWRAVKNMALTMSRNAKRAINTIYIVAIVMIVLYTVAISLICYNHLLYWLPNSLGTCVAQGLGIPNLVSTTSVGCRVWPISSVRNTAWCDSSIDRGSGFSGFCAYVPSNFLDSCAPPKIILDKEDSNKAVKIVCEGVGDLAAYASYGSAFVNRYSRASTSIYILAIQVKRSTLPDKNRIGDALFVVYNEITPLSDKMIDFEAQVNTMVYFVQKHINRLSETIGKADKKNGERLSEREIAQQFFHEVTFVARGIERLHEHSTELQTRMELFKSALDSVYELTADDAGANPAALASSEGPLRRLFETFSAEKYKKTEKYRRHFDILQEVSDQYYEGWTEAQRGFKTISIVRESLKELSKAFGNSAYDFDSDSIHYLVETIKDKINSFEMASQAVNDLLSFKYKQDSRQK